MIARVATCESNAEGLLAQAFQHEGDHLDGILFFDHLESRDQLRKIQREQEPVAVN